MARLGAPDDGHLHAGRSGSDTSDELLFDLQDEAPAKT